MNEISPSQPVLLFEFSFKSVVEKQCLQLYRVMYDIIISVDECGATPDTYRLLYTTTTRTVLHSASLFCLM